MFNSNVTRSLLLGFLFLACAVPSVVAQVDPSTPSTTAVLIGDNPGIPDADAQTAAMLVYDEIRKHGISVSEPAYEVPASASIFRIVMRPLGTKIFVRLSEESPVGTVVELSGRSLLAGIEEMVSAAPRLVDALVGNKANRFYRSTWKMLPSRMRVLHRKMSG